MSRSSLYPLRHLHLRFVVDPRAHDLYTSMTLTRSSVLTRYDPLAKFEVSHGCHDPASGNHRMTASPARGSSSGQASCMIKETASTYRCLISETNILRAHSLVHMWRSRPVDSPFSQRGRSRRPIGPRVYIHPGNFWS